MLGILGFVSIVVFLHIVQSGYNPANQLMSELALGKNGSLMLFAFLSFSLAVFTAQKILYSYSKNIPISILLFTAACSLALAGLFKLGAHTTIHVTLMAAAFGLIVLSMYLTPRLIPQFNHPLAICVCWGLGIGTATTVGLGHSIMPIGIGQRLAALCIFIWLIWLAVYHNKHGAQNA